MKRVLERRKVERIMKNDTRKTVRGLLIAGVVVMAVSIMWPSLAEKYGTSKQTASNVLQSETSSSYSSSSASTSTSASKSTAASTSTASATYSHSAGEAAVLQVLLLTALQARVQVLIQAPVLYREA